MAAHVLARSASELDRLGRAGRPHRFGGFPFRPDGDLSALAWRRPIDDWLAEIATTVFRAARFRLALIGHEVCGDTDAESLHGRVPEQRFIGYLLPRGGHLEYEVANR